MVVSRCRARRFAVGKAWREHVFHFGDSRYHAQAVPRWPAVEPAGRQLVDAALELVLSLDQRIDRVDLGVGVVADAAGRVVVRLVRRNSPCRRRSPSEVGAVSVYLSLPIRSVTHLDEINQWSCCRCCTLCGNLIHLLGRLARRVGPCSSTAGELFWRCSRSRSRAPAAPASCRRSRLGERRQGDPGRVLALVVPDDDVDQVLGGGLERSIFEQGVHIEPVTSSIMAPRRCCRRRRPP